MPEDDGDWDLFCLVWEDIILNGITHSTAEILRFLSLDKPDQALNFDKFLRVCSPAILIALMFPETWMPPVPFAFLPTPDADIVLRIYQICRASAFHTWTLTMCPFPHPSADSLAGKFNENRSLALLWAFCHFEPIMLHKRFCHLWILGL